MEKQYKSSMGHVKGLGAAKSGAHHWLTMRINSVLLAVLSIWFVIQAISLPLSDYQETRAFVSNPLNATLLGLLILATLYHARMGLQEVLEDYVHNRAHKIFKMLMLDGLCLLLAGLTLVSLIKIVNQ
jgi:succinate dehydrogenase / fumarate reductase, membrane anchor subunit